ncbi:Mfa1 family fimbria major subunit [uncultured Prevotella sp.]|uniref:Mfa1 family fimbria major subunit n=1 Tax=uncultured Prevotella sp. TaxID=159272 RepID=UPI0027E31555|nr:Mfa1 family fimbria major subunit [uncultured Prevotella sp.]
MVNVKNLFGMAVMATALVGCSSNDDITPNGNEGAGKAGTAYAKFTIQLPTVSGTRADDPKPGTPSFDGGTANEYAVKDAQLVIFEKPGTSSSEGDYKFVETVNIGNLEPWSNQTPANQGVTRYSDITAQLNGVSLDKTGHKYFALVILNNSSESKVTLPTTGMTYSAWNVASHAKSAADFLNSDNGFYMANAPLYSTDEPTTLVPINGVYSTKAEAQNKPATTVYVERGMAKVTIGSSTFDVDKPVTTSTNYAGDKVTITNWTLDVLNKSTFPVHVTTGLTTGFPDIWKTERFVATSIPQRVYWGKDPNYDKSTLTSVEECQKEFYIVDNNGKTYNGDPSSTFTWSANTTPLYCLENTFDLDNMKQGQTTRVVFKAIYTPHNLTGTDKTFFMIGNNTQIWTKDALEAQITSKAKEMLKSKTVVVTINTDAPLLKGGSHLLSSADVTIMDGSVDKTAAFDYATLNTKLGLNNTETDVNGNPKVGIKTYKNGECYYIARIKHFNELTPWASGQAYGTDNATFLGRYGVLRNNWYDLTVSKVSAPGYPDVPVVNPDVPDDEDTKYINVEVKILDWAKRSQQVEL